jgi:hypothetical protein
VLRARSRDGRERRRYTESKSQLQRDLDMECLGVVRIRRALSNERTGIT